MYILFISSVDRHRDVVQELAPLEEGEWNAVGSSISW